MGKEQIISALAPLYRLECDAYAQLGELAKEAAQEGDTPAFEAISRRAANKSYFLDGVKAAVEALGIGFDEFMEIVNQDRAHHDSGEEDDKCRRQ